MLSSHAVEDSDDNDGNDELMEFDRNACFTCCARQLHLPGRGRPQ